MVITYVHAHRYGACMQLIVLYTVYVVPLNGRAHVSTALIQDTLRIVQV